MTLSTGDTALFYTDGITECRNKEKKELDKEGLVKLLWKHSNLPPQRLQEKIFDEIDSFISGVEQIDDMTLVIIKRIS